jgi:uncharacterized caspase-like protein
MQRRLVYRSANRGLARVDPGYRTLVFYAAKAGEISQDGNGDNSPFAAALAKHLAEPHLGVFKLFQLVSDDVWHATGERQLPDFYGSLPGTEDYYVRP